MTEGSTCSTFARRPTFLRFPVCGFDGTRPARVPEASRAGCLCCDYNTFTMARTQQSTAPKTLVSTRARGDEGEAFACDFLTARGLQIVARNWHPRGKTGDEMVGRSIKGELDIVAWDGPNLAFLEVKTRADGTSSPQEAVTLAKQRQISRLAELFVALELPRLASEVAPDEVACRFDVVEVWMPHGAPARAVHHANAFDWRG
jgi:putative endonuclease